MAKAEAAGISVARWMRSITVTMGRPAPERMLRKPGGSNPDALRHPSGRTSCLRISISPPALLHPSGDAALHLQSTVAPANRSDLAPLKNRVTRAFRSPTDPTTTQSRRARSWLVHVAYDRRVGKLNPVSFPLCNLSYRCGSNLHH